MMKNQLYLLLLMLCMDIQLFPALPVDSFEEQETIKLESEAILKVVLANPWARKQLLELNVLEWGGLLLILASGCLCGVHKLLKLMATSLGEDDYPFGRVNIEQSDGKQY